MRKEPQNWLTYSGTYFSQRYSLLDQITPANVKRLEQQWVYQAAVFGPWQATALIVDGIMSVKAMWRFDSPLAINSSRIVHPERSVT
jgi:glucose dehydrogenase